MINPVYPRKLIAGDEVRIISPSYSMKMVPEAVLQIAEKRLNEMGFVVSYGKNTDKKDILESSSIKERLDDLIEAFKDKKVKGVLAGLGGYNSNYLLDDIDWEVIKENPKFFCGMSDITVLSNAILAKTGLVTYSGVNFRNFGQEKYFDYTMEFFKKTAILDKPFELIPSDYWSDDRWTKDQEQRKLIKNSGWWIINEGKATGQIVGGNLCSINLLQGTEFMPDINKTVLFIEDDSMSTVGEFSRNLQSLVHLDDFKTVRGVVFGRFQKKTKMTKKHLMEIIKVIKNFENIPVIANVDFGHTDPKITFPIGGEVAIKASVESSKIRILKH